MKKLLFILISFFAWGVSTYAQGFIQGLEITLHKDIKENNDTSQEDAPKTRSLIPQPAHAYLYNKVVSISFEEVMPTVTIKIIKEATGETVYLQEYMNPATGSIDLSIQDSGTYCIEISSDKFSLQGEFPL
ncbi:DUF3244 domain-containing protein [Bacteroides stercorirosoris]|uniref:DUF3244 domain-containing protein n=1 Tax=Bacteroides stercorirosoris TaxID=871324 RepID=A0A413H9R7_9BACE|nr:DUF3244 domain-containing protein [Bacteroides stercorirosoris]OKZ11905.1 MAG: hypothetical protein BHV75_06760 [Bacteroides oleiciplenus]RGX80422.1 DUF3244 domain-containing protein [Bacteroides stercorirosoris]